MLISRVPAFLFLALVDLASTIVSASDPSPLQDFCVALPDLNNGVFVNGKFCKDPKQVEAKDFVFFGLNILENTDNQLGFVANVVDVAKLAGLNTLGIVVARLDFALNGLNPPHTHPLATEVLTLLEGTLLVGFLGSNQNNNTFFSKVLYAGDVVVFPEGLIHFQLNIGKTNAVALSGLSSQNPDLITIVTNVFGSTPPISPDVLAKAFQLDVNIVKKLEALFKPST